MQVLPEGYTHALRPTDVSSSPTVARRCDERRGCIWFTKERKKGKKERRGREKKGGKIHLSVTPLLRFIHSFESLGTEREGESERSRPSSSNRYRKKGIPTPAQEGGPSLFRRTQPLNLSIDPGDKRVGTRTRPNPTLPAKNFTDLSLLSMPLPMSVHNFSQIPSRNERAYIEIVQRKSTSSIKRRKE